MTQKKNLLDKNPSHSTGHWWTKLVAAIALINYLLVLFNYSYIPFRHTYLKYVPVVVSAYDPVKGIQPHSPIHNYLNKVDALAEQINNQGLEEETTQQLLKNLRQESLVILDNTTFLIANQLGILAKLKDDIQHHTNTLSANAAFSQFWSPEHLTEIGIRKELEFFNNQIRPLLKITYFRSVNKNGQLVDNFWKIDLFFMIFFALEFFRKSILLSWQHPEQVISKIMLRRWYEAFFFLPFWRWFRIIPLIVKIHQSRLINIEWFLGQLTYEPAAYLSDRISNFLMVRLINQTKDAISNGKITQTLLEPQPYIKVSSVDKTDVIIDCYLK